MYEYDYMHLKDEEVKYYEDAINIKVNDGWRLHTFSPNPITGELGLIFERVKRVEEEPTTMKMG